MIENNRDDKMASVPDFDKDTNDGARQLSEISITQSGASQFSEVTSTQSGSYVAIDCQAEVCGLAWSPTNKKD